MARRATTGNKRATTTRHRQPEARAKGLGKLFTGRRLPGSERPCRVTECTILALETGSIAAQNEPFRNAKRAEPQPSDNDADVAIKNYNADTSTTSNPANRTTCQENRHTQKHNPADGTSDCGYHKTFYLISRFVLAVWHIYVIFA
mgnify:CR=1 FL=1